MSETAQKSYNNVAIFKQNYSLKLFIALNIDYYSYIWATHVVISHYMSTCVNNLILLLLFIWDPRPFWGI